MIPRYPYCDKCGEVLAGFTCYCPKCGELNLPIPYGGTIMKVFRPCPTCKTLLNPWDDKDHEQVCPNCGTTIKMDKGKIR